jgi:prepilin-type N-terminal cleavage/methylation domain-containing protein
MYQRTSQPTGVPQPRTGFTLVELLVVITVIAILIGLLVPAIGHVRTLAKNTATKGVLQSLQTGIEGYKADEKFGGRVPPSASDWKPFGGSARQVVSPYTDSNITISGGGLLVWALSGADFLGTPGFKPFNNFPTWGQSTGNTFGSGPSDSDAYALDNDFEPVQPRAGLYVDIDTIDYTKNEANQGDADYPDFVIAAEAKARRTLGLGDYQREYPLYLDGFGYPILYWRADQAGSKLADNDPDTLSDQSQRGIYHRRDNAELIGGNEALVLSTSADTSDPDYGHALEWLNITTTPPNSLTPGTFPAYIRNNAIEAKYAPHRPDSYLLVSPGADGLYGTADDIANFDHNGQ